MSDGIGIVKDIKEVEEFFKNLGIEYRFSCYHEKNAEGCDLLGDYMSQIKNDYERAAKVYRENCERNKFAKSCTKFGVYSYKGKGCKTNIKRASEYFSLACDYNDPEGCYYSGQMLSGTDPKVAEALKSDINIKKALTQLEKGCDLQMPDSCFTASCFYLHAKAGCPKNMKKAFELSVKGCDLDNLNACTNLSQMYLKGEGTDQNIEMGNKIKAKALDMYNEMRKYRPIEMQRTS